MRENHLQGHVLAAENITVEGSAGRLLLDGVSARFSSSERTALVGVSGSGKTTLLRCLFGLLTPTSGQVTLDGEPPTRERYRLVQYIPQDPPASLPPRLSVEQMVTLPQRRLGLPGGPRERAARAAAAFDQVQLDRSVVRRRREELSGGQAQRVAIARALAVGAQLLLCDEPLTGLDPRLRESMVALLLSIPAGLVFVSHDLPAARALCDRAVVIDGGRVVAAGDFAALTRGTGGCPVLAKLSAATAHFGSRR